MQVRSAYRFIFLLPCLFQIAGEKPHPSRMGLIRDCHDDGASLVSSESIPEGASLRITLTVGDRLMSIDGVVTNSSLDPKEVPSLFRHGIRFTQISDQDRYHLLKYGFQFSVPHFMQQYANPKSVFENLERYLRHDQRNRKRRSLFLPTMVRFWSQRKQHEVMAVTDDISESGISVTCNEDLPHPNHHSRKN